MSDLRERRVPSAPKAHFVDWTPLRGVTRYCGMKNSCRAFANGVTNERPARKTCAICPKGALRGLDPTSWGDKVLRNDKDS